MYLVQSEVVGYQRATFVFIGSVVECLSSTEDLRPTVWKRRQNIPDPGAAKNQQPGVSQHCMGFNLGS